MHWGERTGRPAKLMKSPEDIFDAYLADLAKQGGAPGTGKSEKGGGASARRAARRNRTSRRIKCPRKERKGRKGGNDFRKTNST